MRSKGAVPESAWYDDLGGWWTQVSLSHSEPREKNYTAGSMRILLTNDDGIHAPGIEALHAAIRDMGEVVTVAPADVQSATSHGITFHTPLMISEVAPNDSMRGYAVEGRPADLSLIHI